MHACREKERSQTGPCHQAAPKEIPPQSSLWISEDSFTLEVDRWFLLFFVLTIYFQVLHNKLYYLGGENKCPWKRLHLSTQQGYFSLIVALILIKSIYIMLCKNQTKIYYLPWYFILCVSWLCLPINLTRIFAYLFYKFPHRKPSCVLSRKLSWPWNETMAFLRLENPFGLNWNNSWKRVACLFSLTPSRMRLHLPLFCGPQFFSS